MTIAPVWTKLPALAGRGNPCLCCPPIGASLALDACIAVGFGDAHVARDGDEVYREPSTNDGLLRCDECDGSGHIGSRELPTATTFADYMRALSALPVCPLCGGEGDVVDPLAVEPEYWDVARAEEAAALDPDHDWRIVLFGPLHGEVYQRHGPDQWMLVEKNEGFA